jgi:hypothetical protein
MSELVHADIFFFITSAVVVLVGGAMLIGMYYVVQILRDVSVIVRKIRKASGDIERDLQQLRSEIKTESIKVRTIVDMALGFVAARMKVKKTARPRKPKNTSETLQ